jgi:4-hydroxyproline epimerase
MSGKLARISTVDSHTAGEPTRVVIEGAPELGGGSVAERLKVLQTKHDWLRTTAINEPRGSEVLVGALLCPPADPSCATGVIFFNNVGYIGMCGHGTIGVITTLAHLGRIQPGIHRLETNVGVVTAKLHEDGSVSVTNVPSYRKTKAAPVEIPGLGAIRGDIAWAGNWFYLVEAGKESISLDRVGHLTDIAWQIRQAINSHGYPEIDHVELFGPPTLKGARSKNFVLCPGKAYDRSPCGTGTSAKLACLAADGKLGEGEEWVQESIVGSSFSGRYKWLDRAAGIIEPTIRGSAYITAETTLVIDETDPFRFGVAAEPLN